MSTLPERIEVMDGTHVELTWEDGAVTLLTAVDLRSACMCAVCREPAGEAATRGVVEGAVPVTITNASLVGGYAINFVFAPDNHHTGIFPFAALRAMVSETPDTTDTST